jgi:hypothetical protein
MAAMAMTAAAATLSTPSASPGIRWASQCGMRFEPST